jgi:Zn ribbon nucleic-acid-binding protein
VNTSYRRCPCCGLNQPVALDATGVTARVCAECTHHQGEQDAKRLAKAKRHEQILRERLAACRASESRARSEAAQARSEAAGAREATASALRSRAQLAARLAEAADESGNHRCAAMGIARDPEVTRWAREAESDTRPGW